MPPPHQPSPVKLGQTWMDQAVRYGHAPHATFFKSTARSDPAGVTSPERPFENLPCGHLLGVVVVAVENLPEEGLVHGQLAGLATVPRLGA